MGPGGGGERGWIVRNVRVVHGFCRLQGFGEDVFRRAVHVGGGWFIWLVAEEPSSFKVQVSLNFPSNPSPNKSMAFVPGSYAMEAP